MSAEAPWPGFPFMPETVPYGVVAAEFDERGLTLVVEEYDDPRTLGVRATPTQQKETTMSEHNIEEEPPALPELDLVRLVEQATARRDYFVRRRDEAQREVDAANEYLARLRPEPAAEQVTITESGEPKAVSEQALRGCVRALCRHQYAGIDTIANGAGFSSSTASYAMRIAVQRGLATVEKRGRRFRYYPTDAGKTFAGATSAEEESG